MKVFKGIIVYLSFLLLITNPLFSQDKQRPKLLIGIVVDQMRYDYLQRFEKDFGPDGFKRLQSQGLSLSNMNFNYKPTTTAPGHASIFTGTTPSIHGIVGNSWYSRKENDWVYCVRHKDSLGNSIYDPSRLRVNTLADEIKLSLGFNSKVYGVSLKDRGAILPAGNLAEAAYWFEGKQGGFISSKYYKNQSPEWLNKFNQEDFFDQYLADGWDLYKDPSVYEELEDDRSFERAHREGGSVSFPYDFAQLYEEEGDDLIKVTPFGNSMLIDFSKELIKNEGLGKDEQMDFISISFSATDYIGHQFGVRSREVMDTYLRLDQELAGFLDFLDEEIGEGNYLLFLTADHGASENRHYLNSLGIEANYLDRRAIERSIESHLDSIFGDEDWLLAIANWNIYLNHELFNKNDQYDKSQIIGAVKDYCFGIEGIAGVFDPEEGQDGSWLHEKTARGYHRGESGDLILIEKANWNSYPAGGSGHSSPYIYDTHVPAIFYGWKVKKKELNQQYQITDIIPSIAEWLSISKPDGVSSYRSILNKNIKKTGGTPSTTGLR